MIPSYYRADDLDGDTLELLAAPNAAPRYKAFLGVSVSRHDALGAGMFLTRHNAELLHAWLGQQLACDCPPSQGYHAYDCPHFNAR